MFVAFIAVDAVVASLIFYAATSSLRPLRENCRPAPPALDAEHRRYQSFSIGMYSLGWSVHVALDRDYVHLTPIVPVRLLGAPELSIPRRDIRVDHVSKGVARARVHGVEIVGPEWCLRPA
jgi:hypothetical protein